LCSLSKSRRTLPDPSLVRLFWWQGIGLPLEEAMKFWRTEFAPKHPGEAFDKHYAYNVRYNYAKEGKRTDYTPYSCLKIITTPVPKVCLRTCRVSIIHGLSAGTHPLDGRKGDGLLQAEEEPF
jgi:DNA primase large subunit